jgi:hypothetical protein
MTKDLREAALDVYASEEQKRKEKERTERNRQAALNARAAKSALTKARKWAIPILNEKFGEQEWVFVNASAEQVDVYIDSKRNKTLTVYKTGIIIGRFQVAASGGRYSNTPGRYEKVTIRDLRHLGACLATEAKCIDQELMSGLD